MVWNVGARRREPLSLELSLHAGEKKGKRSHGLLGDLSHDGLEPQPQRHKGEMMGPRFVSAERVGSKFVVRNLAPQA